MNLILLSLFAFALSVHAMLAPPTLVCTFKTESSLYGCKVDSIRGIHKMYPNFRRVDGDMRSGSVVKFLKSDGVKIETFPGFSSVFGDLEKVIINRAGLKEISSDDLKQFGDKLKVLDLGFNEIEFLEKNLFVHNKNLERINFNDNKVRHVTDGAFNKLTKVEILNFQSNPCYFSDMMGGLQLVSEIQNACKDKFYKRIDDLEKELGQVKNEIATIKRNQG